MSEPVAKAMLLCPEALQSDVVTDLRELWKAIGEPDDAQETKLQEIEKRAAEVLRAAVRAEEGHKTQLEEALEHMKCQLSELSATLAEPPPDLAAEAPGLLVQRHAAANAALEQYKSQRATRAAQRREMEAHLVSLHTELSDASADGSPPIPASQIVPGPGPAEKDGLSERFLGLLKAKLGELQAERAARIEQAAFLSMDIGRLQKELGMDAEQPGSPRRDTLVLGAQEAGATGSSHQVSPAALAALDATLKELQAEKEKRLRLLRESGSYIAELRAKLKLGEGEGPTLPAAEAVGRSRAPTTA